MTYLLLGHTLHETADRAKKYFAREYGATHFLCEQVVEADLPLRPTWQATMQAGDRLCVEVRESPFSQTLYEFVTKCVTEGHPVRLWVALPPGASSATFSKELKDARQAGVGVAQIAEDSSAHEFHRPLRLSLLGLRRTDFGEVPKNRRESLKSAEGEFLSGSPEQGCQRLCQELESVTRRFAEYSHKQGWWKGKGSKPPTKKFFATDSWATMLDRLDEEIDQAKVKPKCSSFKRSLVAGARQHTDWRNSLSHKPKTMRERQRRDARLRTMFETVRDLLIEWYVVARALKLAP